MNLLNLVQITAFFLKFILYLGPHDELNKWRLLWWMLLGMPIVREMYVFTAVDRPKRLGHNVWLGLGILVIEWAFIFKFGEEEIASAGAIRGVDPCEKSNSAPFSHLENELICQDTLGTKNMREQLNKQRRVSLRSFRFNPWYPVWAASTMLIGEKLALCVHFLYILSMMILLPRQARDKRRKNSKRVAFS